MAVSSFSVSRTHVVYHQEQKEAALQRAAELVASNRVPIEITRGSAAAKAALANNGLPSQQLQKRGRSAIVVSTAGDLHRIVLHSSNLWAKYNAIAKEHNQKVSWATVSKELGIHVKVREKYARMHSRAEQRGFDWERNIHWKIKDHPEIFLEPTPAERRAKMPLPPPNHTTTVMVDGTKEISHEATVDDSVVDAPVTVVNGVDEEDDEHEPFVGDDPTEAFSDDVKVETM